MAFKSLQFCGIAVVLMVVSLCAAEIYNGDFEIIDPNAPMDTNVPAGSDPFVTPLGWEYENRAAVMDIFIPSASRDVSAWLINPETGLSPFLGSYFLIVSNGEYSPDPGREVKTYARQKIVVYPGQTIKGAYFFGTSDYYKWSDAAQIAMYPNDVDMNDIYIVEIDVDDVGDHSCTDGWQRFSYVFGPNEGGVYDLEISVWDVEDSQLDTYFAVDNLIICEEDPGQGDINMDCVIDMRDFAMVAADWMYDCSSDVYPGDANHFCFVGSDIDQSGLVDVNELIIITENWLEGVPEDRFCDPEIEHGDINDDCRVDFLDIAMFGVDWTADCNVNNDYGFLPGSNCRFDTDMDGVGLVDAADLILMLDNWLAGTE